MKQQRLYQVGLRLFAAIGILTTLCIAVLVILLFGRMQVNQFNLWKLKLDFYHVASVHPPESFLLEKKTYIGGPYDHGSQTCGVFVGELRAAPLSREEIRYAYAGRSVDSLFLRKRIPLKVLFFGEEPWPLNSPLGDWWDEWRESPLLATSSTVFFVFAAREEYPSWGDFRCDD